MKNDLLEEHVRYGEARFRDKNIVRPFVNRIYQDLAELEEAMNHGMCDGCTADCSAKDALNAYGQFFDYPSDMGCKSRFEAKDK